MPSLWLPTVRAPAFFPRPFQQAPWRRLTLTMPPFRAALPAQQIALGSATQGAHQAVPLLETLQPRVSLKPTSLPCPTRSWVAWASFLTGLSSHDSSLPCACTCARVWDWWGCGEVRRGVLGIFCAPKSCQVGKGTLQTYWPSHHAPDAPRTHLRPFVLVPDSPESYSRFLSSFRCLLKHPSSEAP